MHLFARIEGTKGLHAPVFVLVCAYFCPCACVFSCLRVRVRTGAPRIFHALAWTCPLALKYDLAAP